MPDLCSRCKVRALSQTSWSAEIYGVCDHCYEVATCGKAPAEHHHWWSRFLRKGSVIAQS
jgi:hypothetical protein